VILENAPDTPRDPEGGLRVSIGFAEVFARTMCRTKWRG